MEHNMVFIQLHLPSLIREELEVRLMGICANLKADFPSCADGWWMLRARPGQIGCEHETHEILEEKIASNTSVELDNSYFALLSHSLGLNFLTPCVTCE